MAVIDDLRQAVSQALAAGSSAARAQGTALRGDFENLVRPQLDDVLVQIESISSQFVVGDIGEDQARDDLNEQSNRVVPLILGVTELSELALQTVINAVMDALKAAVNKAAGVVLL